MLETLLNIAGTAGSLYGCISGVKTGKQLVELQRHLDALGLEVNRLSESVSLLDTVVVTDTTRDAQAKVTNPDELAESLAPVQHVIGGHVLSSTAILTPDKLRRAFEKNPCAVLLDVRPVRWTTAHANPDMVPFLFAGEGNYYVGWQARGIIPTLLDCAYDPSLWLPGTEAKRTSTGILPGGLRTPSEVLSDTKDFVLNQRLCRECGKSVDRTWKVCGNCGTRIEQRCIHCGCSCSAILDYCPSCGATLGEQPLCMKLCEVIGEACENMSRCLQKESFGRKALKRLEATDSTLDASLSPESRLAWHEARYSDLLDALDGLEVWCSDRNKVETWRECWTTTADVVWATFKAKVHRKFQLNGKAAALAALRRFLSSFERPGDEASLYHRQAYSNLARRANEEIQRLEGLPWN